MVRRTLHHERDPPWSCWRVEEVQVQLSDGWVPSRDGRVYGENQNYKITRIRLQCFLHRLCEYNFFILRDSWSDLSFRTVASTPQVTIATYAPPGTTATPCCPTPSAGHASAQRQKRTLRAPAASRKGSMASCVLTARGSIQLNGNGLLNMIFKAVLLLQGGGFTPL